MKQFLFILLWCLAAQKNSSAQPLANTLMESGLNRNTQLKISNTLGQIFLQQKTDSNAISIDVSGLKPGIYVIQIVGENNKAINKTLLKN